MVEFPKATTLLFHVYVLSNNITNRFAFAKFLYELYTFVSSISSPDGAPPLHCLSQKSIILTLSSTLFPELMSSLSFCKNVKFRFMCIAVIVIFLPILSDSSTPCGMSISVPDVIAVPALVKSTSTPGAFKLPNANPPS